MLINPDFKINQRGGKIVESGITYYSDSSLSTSAGTTTTAYKATYVSSTVYSITIDSTVYYVSADNVVDGYIPNYSYTVDRWVANDVLVVLSDEYITLTRTDTSAMFFIQRFEQDYYKNHIANKQVTLSIMLSDGTIKTGTGVTSGYKETGGFSVSINSQWYMYTSSYDSGVSLFGISCSSEDNIEPLSIKWVKMELGSIATPFVPPDTATELLKCMRYYWSGKLLGRPCTSTHNNKQFNFQMPIRMRIQPSISISNLRTVTNTVEISYSYIGLGITQTNGNTVSFWTHGSTTGEWDHSTHCLADVIFDAEIY